MSEPVTVEDRERERLAEYCYVALEPINLEGGRAFNVGDRVPKGHLDSGKVLPSQVAKPDTKSGQRAVAAVTDENLKG